MLKTTYRIKAGMGALGMSVVTRDKQDLAWIDDDVKEGLRWAIKFFTEEEKQNAFLEVTEEKFALTGEGGKHVMNKWDVEGAFEKYLEKHPACKAVGPLVESLGRLVRLHCED